MLLTLNHYKHDAPPLNGWVAGYDVEDGLNHYFVFCVTFLHTLVIVVLSVLEGAPAGASPCETRQALMPNVFETNYKKIHLIKRMNTKSLHA